MGLLKLMKDYGFIFREDKELKSYKWCFRNKILIGPIPCWGDNYGSWTVEITMKGNKNG